MPDPNKHAALSEAGFKLQETCSSCVHWAPTGTSGHGWGRCSAVRYQHEKHSEENKRVGTPESGWCRLYGQDLRALTLAVGDDYAARYSTEPDPPPEE